MLNFRHYTEGMATPPGFSFNMIAPPLFDRARPMQPLPAPPRQAPAGSLVMVDTFQESPSPDPKEFGTRPGHGNVGSYAARQHGFRGNVYAEPIGPDAAPPFAMPPQVNWAALSNEQVRARVRDASRDNSVSLLGSVTGDLDKQRKLGLHNSAVNVSYGESARHSAGSYFSNVLNDLMYAPPGQPGMGTRTLQAYGIDRSKFDNPDPKVSGPEWLKLQQGLLTDSEAGQRAPEVNAATGRYRQAVRNLEANHNSVVVSAGNSESQLQDWSSMTNGQRVREGAGSNRNVLSVPEVTTVGATQWLRDRQGGLHERVAPYSSRDGADIYASGSVGNGVNPQRMKSPGTSFAAPRVAQAMATLHKLHPSLSSSQVESLLRNQATHQVNDGAAGPVDVLDYGRSLQLGQTLH